MQKHHRQTTLDMIGITYPGVLMITGFAPANRGMGESKILLIISFVFAFTHLAFYLYRLGKHHEPHLPAIRHHGASTVHATSPDGQYQ